MITWNIKLDETKNENLQELAKEICYRYKSAFIKPEKIVVSGIGSGQCLFDKLKEDYPSLPVEIEHDITTEKLSCGHPLGNIMVVGGTLHCSLCGRPISY